MAGWGGLAHRPVLVLGAPGVRVHPDRRVRPATSESIPRRSLPQIVCGLVAPPAGVGQLGVQHGWAGVPQELGTFLVERSVPTAHSWPRSWGHRGRPQGTRRQPCTGPPLPNAQVSRQSSDTCLPRPPESAPRARTGCLRPGDSAPTWPSPPFCPCLVFPLETRCSSLFDVSSAPSRAPVSPGALSRHWLPPTGPREGGQERPEAQP